MGLDGIGLGMMVDIGWNVSGIKMVYIQYIVMQYNTIEYNTIQYNTIHCNVM